MQNAFVYMYVCVRIYFHIFVCICIYRYTQNLSGKTHKKLVTSDCLPGQELDS